MTHLLDGNVLVALLVDDHVHHDAAEDWFGDSRQFATSPITQGTLIRHLFRNGAGAAVASEQIRGVMQRTDHEFWLDDFDYGDVNLRGVIGHRQLTDAYLAELARRHGAKLATFDRGFAAVHPDVAELVPT